MVAVPRGTPGLGRNKGWQAGPFSFVLSTLGLCSCLALLTDGTRSMAGEVNMA